MEYVLIIMMLSGGPAVTTATFDTKEACESASQRVYAEWNKPGWRTVSTICVPKG